MSCDTHARGIEESQPRSEALNNLSPVGYWTKHWDPSSELFFYYERLTGQTTWDRPKPPDHVLDPPRSSQSEAVPAAAVEGIVLQQAHSKEAHSLDKKEDAPHHDLFLHHRSGHPRGRKRISSKDNKVYSDALFKGDMPDEEPRKDYIGFAKEYCVTAPFRDTDGKQSCVICQKRKSSGVFFPCEHKCVCRRCIEREGFGQTAVASMGGSLCPVCCQQVVFVAPSRGGGKETELYWRWVEEVKPSLPSNFRHNFHMAAILLKIKSETDSDETWNRPSESACCVLS